MSEQGWQTVLNILASEISNVDIIDEVMGKLRKSIAPPEPLPREQSVVDAAEALVSFVGQHVVKMALPFAHSFHGKQNELATLLDNLRATLDREAEGESRLLNSHEQAEVIRNLNRLNKLALAVGTAKQKFSGGIGYAPGIEPLYNTIAALVEEVKQR